MQTTRHQPNPTNPSPFGTLRIPDFWNRLFPDNPYRQALRVLKETSLSNITLEHSSHGRLESFTIKGEHGSLKVLLHGKSAQQSLLALELLQEGKVTTFDGEQGDGKRLINKTANALGRLTKRYLKFSENALSALCENPSALVHIPFSEKGRGFIGSLPEALLRGADSKIIHGPHEVRSRYVPAWSPPPQMAIEADMARDSYYRSHWRNGNMSPPFPYFIPHSQPEQYKLELVCPILEQLHSTPLGLSYWPATRINGTAKSLYEALRKR